MDGLVSRDREFGVLRELCVAATGGSGALVQGEAGSGKSALAEELIRFAAGERIPVLVPFSDGERIALASRAIFLSVRVLIETEEPIIQSG